MKQLLYLIPLLFIVGCKDKEDKKTYDLKRKTIMEIYELGYIQGQSAARDYIFSHVKADGTLFHHYDEIRFTYDSLRADKLIFEK